MRYRFLTLGLAADPAVGSSACAKAEEPRQGGCSLVLCRAQVQQRGGGGRPSPPAAAAPPASKALARRLGPAALAAAAAAAAELILQPGAAQAAAHPAAGASAEQGLYLLAVGLGTAGTLLTVISTSRFLLSL